METYSDEWILKQMQGRVRVRRGKVVKKKGVQDGYVHYPVNWKPLKHQGGLDRKKKWY